MSQWVARDCGDDIQAPLPMPRLLWQILKSRGLSSSTQVEKFLAPSLGQLSRPGQLKNMDIALERLLEAWKKNQHICVYGDFDLDGTSGLALLVSGFKDLGFQNVSFIQPQRLKDGYGLHCHLLEKLKADGVELVITVDVGITALEPAKFAKKIGIDLIITDHHLPGTELPQAIAVINPNQADCTSGLGYLCGAGVGFYVLMGLKPLICELDKNYEQVNLKNYLDCFAIGTLTDLVPLVEDNRILVKHGLSQLENTLRPGLRALLEQLGLDNQRLTSQDVAIRFAPKLNALSRMEKGLTPLELYMETSLGKARSLVQRVLEQNDLRIHLQKDGEALAKQMLEENPPKKCIFVFSKKFHRGVIGLIATRLAQDFNLPSYVGYLDDEGNIFGSARSPSDGKSVLPGLESASEKLVQYGGHNPAAGFELVQDRAHDFYQCLEAHFSHSQTDQTPKQVYDSDAELEELNAQFMKWFANLEPFGTKFERPLFRISAVHLKSVRELKGGHYKFTLKSPKTSYCLDGLWFSPNPSHQVLKNGPQIGEIIDVLAYPQWNYFRGKQSLQLILEDVRPHS